MKNCQAQIPSLLRLLDTTICIPINLEADIFSKQSANAKVKLSSLVSVFCTEDIVV